MNDADLEITESLPESEVSGRNPFHASSPPWGETPDTYPLPSGEKPLTHTLSPLRRSPCQISSPLWGEKFLRISSPLWGEGGVRGLQKKTNYCPPEL